MMTTWVTVVWAGASTTDLQAGLARLLPGLPWGVLGLLLGYCLWSVARCYAQIFDAETARDAHVLPDARLLWRACRGGLRHAMTPFARDDVQRPWLAAIPALALAASYTLLAAWYTDAPATALGLAWAVTLLMLLALIDARTRLLPDALTLPLLWTGLGLALVDRGLVMLPEALAAVMVAYVFLWLLAWLFLTLRGHDGLGGGDVKLLAAIGAWVGWPDVLFVLLCASATGILTALAVARGRHLGAQLPFGPHLAGAAIVWLILRATGAV